MASILGMDEMHMRSYYMEGRSVKISTIRLTAMVSIVLCHFCCYYQHELLRWLDAGVQVFLFLSGFLYGKKGDLGKDFIKRNFIKLLVDAWVFILIISPVYYLFRPDLFSIKSVVNHLLFRNLGDGFGTLWFIPTILLAYFITPYLFSFREKIVVQNEKNFIFLSGGGGFVCTFILTTEFFSKNPVWIFCYVFGYLFGCYSQAHKIQYTDNLIIAAGAVWNGLEIVVKYILHSSIAGTNLFILWDNIGHALLGMSVFFVLWRMIKDDLSKYRRWKRVLAFSDKYSFDIYIVHYMFIAGPLNLQTMTGNHLVNTIMIVLVILAVSILIRFLSKFITKRLTEPEF